MHQKIVLVVAMIIVVSSSMFPVTFARQTNQTKPTVPLVSAVGCVDTADGSWFLSRATEPKETQAPFATEADVEEARNATLGSNRFELIGVAEFLDVEGLLALHQRAEFTAPESVNATGQLVSGTKVAVKGLHITAAGLSRLNLTSVISLADTCD